MATRRSVCFVFVVSTALWLLWAQSAPAGAQQQQTCAGLAVTVDLAAGQRPTSGPDVILGTPGADTISAGNGDDVICAGAGNDTIVAGAGDDLVIGGAGADTVRAGRGADTVAGQGGNDALDGGSGNDTIRGGTGDDRVVGGSGTDRVRGGKGDDVIAVRDGEADVASGARGSDTCTSDTGLDTVRRCRQQPIGRGPFAIALMVADAGRLTPQERSLTAMLEGNGHRVTPFTVTARPIVNAVNNPTIDLLLFSPSFEYTQLYHPAQRNSLPMLDMAKNAWYRRYVAPWGDDIVGPRFSTISDTSTRVHYDDAGVIPWTGQSAGPVRVLRVPRFSGGALMRRVIDYSTRGAAQHFLRHTSDTGAESTIGVYVPPGSTITKPAPTRAEEKRRRSVAPWLGLVLFNDDFGDGNQYRQLTPAGESLFEAAMARLMNP